MKAGDIVCTPGGNSIRVKRVYRLYLWNVTLPRQGKIRGRCIGTFARYKDLVAEAKRRTVAAGYPKTWWMALYDWNVS